VLGMPFRPSEDLKPEQGDRIPSVTLKKAPEEKGSVFLLVAVFFAPASVFINIKIKDSFDKGI